MFLDYLREDPRALHVMTYVMGASPQLSEILVRTPEYFHWLVRRSSAAPQIGRTMKRSSSRRCRRSTILSRG